MQSKNPAGDDFVIEVKNHSSQIKKAEVEKFIALKKELQLKLKARTGFIFYSQKPLSKNLVDLLKENNIILMYGESISKIE